MSFTTSLSSVRRFALPALAAVAMTVVFSGAARAGMFSMVDAQTNTGDMVLNYLGANYVGGEWNIALQAANTGSQSYSDVNLMLQFIWDSATTPETPLTYTSPNSWAGSGDSFSLADYTIGAGPQTPPVLIPWTDANTPLTWGGTPAQGLATIGSGDSVPAVPLGDFAPGYSEDFNILCPANEFDPDGVGFFVAVPEPSTLALLFAAGAGIWGCAWRRRRAERQV